MKCSAWLNYVSDGERGVTYGYLDNSPLVGNITYWGSALSVSKQYDGLRFTAPDHD